MSEKAETMLREVVAIARSANLKPGRPYTIRMRRDNKYIDKWHAILKDSDGRVVAEHVGPDPELRLSAWQTAHLYGHYIVQFHGYDRGLAVTMTQWLEHFGDLDDERNGWLYQRARAYGRLLLSCLKP